MERELYKKFPTYCMQTSLWFTPPCVQLAGVCPRLVHANFQGCDLLDDHICQGKTNSNDFWVAFWGMQFAPSSARIALRPCV
eukprot:1157907-Pelagomonas_calceolata.AAC.3